MRIRKKKCRHRISKVAFEIIETTVSSVSEKKAKTKQKHEQLLDVTSSLLSFIV